MLTAVSFKKGREALPRLSAPYVPGTHSERYWTEDEIDLVRQHYEADGTGVCLSKLPGRTLAGVYNQARKMGLKRPHRAPRTEPIGARLDDTIRERWPSLVKRGAVQNFADELGIRRHTLSQRALALGLVLPHRKEPLWSDAENELLRSAPVNNPNAASSFFAAHGFSRSPASIMVRCKRVGLSRRLQGVLSGTAAAKILGIDGKTMGVWCADGVMPAAKRGTKRLPQQGGDTWTILPADLRQFIIDQIDRIDIRKVDKHAFVALLAGGAK